MSHRTCSKCKRHLPISEFTFHNKAKDKRRSICKHCHAAENRLYRASKRIAATTPTPCTPICPLPAVENNQSWFSCLWKTITNIFK